MKSLSIFTLFAFFAIMIPQTVKAGVLLEPYLGYSVGNIDDDDQMGPSMGLRAGYSMMGLAVGAEYHTGTWNWDTSSGDVDATPQDIGAFVSYSLPLMLRFYGSYYFDSTNELDNDADQKLTGSAIKLGVGLTTFPLISINLDYTKYTYDDCEWNSSAVAQSGSCSNVYDDFEADMYMISASLPFNL